MPRPPELAPHLLQAKPHPSLDRSERLLEQLRDLVVGVAAEVRKLDRLTLLVGQSVQGSPHATRLLASRNLHVRALPRLVTLLHHVERLPSSVVDRAPPQPVDRPVVDDAEHPCAHASARLVVAEAASPDRQKRLLHHVLRRRLLPHHPIGERERRSAVAVVKSSKARGSPCCTSCMTSSSAKSRMSCAIRVSLRAGGRFG